MATKEEIETLKKYAPRCNVKDCVNVCRIQWDYMGKIHFRHCDDCHWERVGKGHYISEVK